MEASEFNKSFITVKEIEEYIRQANENGTSCLFIPASLSISDETIRQLIDNGFKISLKYKIEWDTM